MHHKGKFREYYDTAIFSSDIQDEGYNSCVSDLLALKEVQSLASFPQHLEIDRLTHVRTVSYMSYRICTDLGLDSRAAARGGLLHDLYYYDWKDASDVAGNDGISHRFHGYKHPYFARKNAKRIVELTPKEENIIVRHMWPFTPIPPKYREGYIITLCDKYAATREHFYAREQERQHKK